MRDQPTATATLARRRLLVMPLLAAFMLPVYAETIYTWVDSEGVRHFSEYRPADERTETESLEIERTTPPDYDPVNDHYSVLNQARRTHERRVAVEEERAAQRARRQAAEDAANATLPPRQWRRESYSACCGISQRTVVYNGHLWYPGAYFRTYPGGTFHRVHTRRHGFRHGTRWRAKVGHQSGTRSVQSISGKIHVMGSGTKR